MAARRRAHPRPLLPVEYQLLDHLRQLPDLLLDHHPSRTGAGQRGSVGRLMTARPEPTGNEHRRGRRGGQLGDRAAGAGNHQIARGENVLHLGLEPEDHQRTGPVYRDCTAATSSRFDSSGEVEQLEVGPPDHSWTISTNARLILADPRLPPMTPTTVTSGSSP